MRLHTKKTGKEDLIILPVTEGFDKKRFSKKMQNYLDKHEHFIGRQDTQLLLQGKQDNLFLGIGKQASQDAIRKAAGTAAKYARDHHHKHYGVDLRTTGDQAQAAAEGTLLGLYRYHEYKKRKAGEPQDPTHCTIITDDHKIAGKQVKRGKVIAEGVILVRDLVNTPASEKYPAKIANLAKELGKRHGFSVAVLGKKELEKLGMESMLSVSRGSDKEPQLVLLELNNDKQEAPVALAGKGVTFDAGGLQVKPDPYMREMKLDMGGAATVLGTMTALARLKHPGRIIGALGLVENMLGPDAYKPGDILKAYNDKTIEVEHTDAEGRLVLADVLSYLEKQYKPTHLIDLATLTGSAIYALGYRVTPLLGNDKELIEGIKLAAEQTDELVWELPLYKHYEKMVEGAISDVRNLGKKPSGMGAPGTIIAAAFLKNFVTDKVAWAHLDIAGTAFSYEKTAYVPEGGTGWGVRLLTELFTQSLER
ncbi:leucyl aminopeptidase [Candidatus Woesearchaeota archaeon]|nr:leucyl aminopeptidase [Candidatus Woesearchaeota archaeon]